MRCLFACLCALLLASCAEPTKPRVIVKTVVVEKWVKGPCPGCPEPPQPRYRCPQDVARWQDHCWAIKNEHDCNAEQMCEWHGKSHMRCQIIRCHEGLPWPR